MRKVDLSGKNEGRPPILIRAVLIGADLSDANLNGADLRGADLSYTTMARAYLGSAILNGATMVDVQGATIAGVCQTATLPALRTPRRAAAPLQKVARRGNARYLPNGYLSRDRIIRLLRTTAVSSMTTPRR